MMFSKVFRDTAEKRAIAGLVNEAALEIVRRRDAVVTIEDSIALLHFETVYNVFTKVWANTDVSPTTFEYAAAWDTHLASTWFTSERKMQRIVTNHSEVLFEAFFDTMHADLDFSALSSAAQEHKIPALV